MTTHPDCTIRCAHSEHYVTTLGTYSGSSIISDCPGTGPVTSVAPDAGGTDRQARYEDTLEQTSVTEDALKAMALASKHNAVMASGQQRRADEAEAQRDAALAAVRNLEAQLAEADAKVQRVKDAALGTLMQTKRSDSRGFTPDGADL